MDLNTFWQLVESARGQEDPVEFVAGELARFTTENIVRFRLLHDDLMARANLVDLWGAAHVIQGGCTEDGFFDFRESLIEAGRTLFEKAVGDPDSLATLLPQGKELPPAAGLVVAAQLAWTNVTGLSEEQFFETVDALDSRNDRAAPEEGEWWNFDDRAEIRHRLPGLAARFYPGEG